MADEREQGVTGETTPTTVASVADALVEQVAAAQFDFAERRAHSFATWADEGIANWRRENFRARAADTIEALGAVGLSVVDLGDSITSEGLRALVDAHRRLSERIAADDCGCPETVCYGPLDDPTWCSRDKDTQGDHRLQGCPRGEHVHRNGSRWPSGHTCGGDQSEPSDSGGDHPHV